LVVQEDRVMEFWAERKKSLEESLLFVEVETAVEETTLWIRDTADVYLRRKDEHFHSHSQDKEALLRENSLFKAAAKVYEINKSPVQNGERSKQFRSV